MNLKSNPNNWSYLYCDSATSCIVVIVTGCNANSEPIVAISHLSRPQRFECFLEKVCSEFVGNIHLFAHGANPPEPGIKDGKNDYTALRNAGIIMNFVLAHSVVQLSEGIEPAQPQIDQVTLLFGEGNPSDYDSNLDCYGVDVSNPEELIVSNKRLTLQAEDRDPTGGLQSLFCSYGLDNGMVLLKASEAYCSEISTSLYANKDKLLGSAHSDKYEQYVNMSDEEILAKCSSTPDAEVPWFCDSIRRASQYVIDNYKS
ncbi:MAG: hypothetical protein SNG20_07240 [Rikenellaceae bacterium]